MMSSAQRKINEELLIVLRANAGATKADYLPLVRNPSTYALAQSLRAEGDDGFDKVYSQFNIHEPIVIVFYGLLIDVYAGENKLERSALSDAECSAVVQRFIEMYNASHYTYSTNSVCADDAVALAVAEGKKLVLCEYIEPAVSDKRNLQALRELAKAATPSPAKLDFMPYVKAPTFADVQLHLSKLANEFEFGAFFSDTDTFDVLDGVTFVSEYILIDAYRQREGIASTWEIPHQEQRAMVERFCEVSGASHYVHCDSDPDGESYHPCQAMLLAKSEGKSIVVVSV